MSQYAPERPTTQELAVHYPLNTLAEVEVPLSRERINLIMNGETPGFVGVLGPCALNNQVEIVRKEGDTLTGLTQDHEGLYAVHRMPVWKPRSKPEAWWGLETTDPEGAYRTIIGQANRGDAVAIEVEQPYHLERYEPALSLAWIGARQRDHRFMEWVATTYPDLPLGIKNGLDGTVEPTLEVVQRLRELRGPDGGAVFLLYRGGENAKTPDTWEATYRQALALTDGLMMVDAAHGTEMAFDPDGKFQKSVDGELRAMRRIVALAEAGETPVPAALMGEASAADKTVDPHAPLQIMIGGVRRLHALRMQQPTSVAVYKEAW